MNWWFWSLVAILFGLALVSLLGAPSVGELVGPGGDLDDGSDLGASGEILAVH